jgi:hypothetical protein
VGTVRTRRATVFARTGPVGVVIGLVVGLVVVGGLVIDAGSLVGSLIGGPVGVVAGVGVGVGLGLVVGVVGRSYPTKAARRAMSGQTAGLRGVSRLLPTHARQDYLEEWQAWLVDLREQCTPWYRRLLEVLGIVLIATPRLAVQLRLAGRQGAGD